MSAFVLVGAGGLGREFLGWFAGDDAEARARFRVDAFISERDDAGGTCHGVPVLRPDDWTGPAPRFLITISDTSAKKRIALAMEARGWTAETYVHSSAAVGLLPRIGAGTIVGPHCRISTDCDIGAHVLVNPGSGVAHDARVGDYASLLGAVSVNGGVRVGEGALLGAGCMVYPGKTVGDWATIGMGSVVLRNVPAKATMFGNPARRIDAR